MLARFCTCASSVSRSSSSSRCRGGEIEQGPRGCRDPEAVLHDNIAGEGGWSARGQDAGAAGGESRTSEGRTTRRPRRAHEREQRRRSPIAEHRAGSAREQRSQLGSVRPAERPRVGTRSRCTRRIRPSASRCTVIASAAPRPSRNCAPVTIPCWLAACPRDRRSAAHRGVPPRPASGLRGTAFCVTAAYAGGLASGREGWGHVLRIGVGGAWRTFSPRQGAGKVRQGRGNPRAKSATTMTSPPHRTSTTPGSVSSAAAPS